MNRRLIFVLVAGLLCFGMVGVAFANPSPNGPGQPGAPGTICGSPGAENSPPGQLTDAFPQHCWGSLCGQSWNTLA